MADYRDRKVVEERARRGYEALRDELLNLYFNNKISDNEMCRRLKGELKPLRDALEEEEKISLASIIAAGIEFGGEQAG